MKMKTSRAIFGLVAVLLFLVQLAGCTVGPKFTLRPDARYPYDYYYTSAANQPGRALVIIGAFGDDKITRIKQKRRGTQDNEWVVTLVDKLNDVYLVPVEVGNDFAINTVQVTSMRSGMAMHADIKSAKTIQIDRPGIYYYGKIVFNKGIAHTAYELDNAVINLAKKKYPEAFNGDLPAVDF
jgi:hypothetical protein